MLSKIKEEFKTTVIGFGKSGLPLGERDDIDDLAIMALESQNPELLKLFELPMPSLDQMKKERTDADLKKSGAVVDTNQSAAVAQDQSASITQDQPHEEQINRNNTEVHIPDQPAGKTVADKKDKNAQ